MVLEQKYRHENLSKWYNSNTNKKEKESMSKEKKSYDEEFKKTIVSLYESGKKMADLSREYGISHTNIGNWIKKYGTITTSTGEVTNNDEIMKLKKQLREVELENEILKKAVAIFSKKQMIKSTL